MDVNNPQPRLYGELASWWPLLSAPADYLDEAAFFEEVLTISCSPSPETMLELGSGGGNNASHLKKSFDMTLVDHSPEMLRVSRLLNPECEHIEGDMRTVRLDRVFDAVFVHDAVMYMTTEVDLRSVVETAFTHCRSGGIAMFVPDHVRETFQPTTKKGGHDGDGRSLRYLSWTWDPDPNDTTYVVDFVYLLRDESGEIRPRYDRHVCGLFERRTWLRLINEVGFQARIIPYEDRDEGQGMIEMFLGWKPDR